MFEANTIDTEARIEALCKLREAGIKTNALICPVIPHITDVIKLVDMLAPYTDVIWIFRLNVEDHSGKIWNNILNILNNHFPNMKEEIETITFSKDHLYWTQLKQDLFELQKIRNLNLSIHL